MKLLVVLEWGRVMASGTVRGLIYETLMKNAGYDVRFVNHYPEMGLHVRGLNRVYGLLSERIIPRMAATADIIYLSKVTSLSFVKRIREAAPRARIVLDFGDAVWLKAESEAKPFNEVLQLVDAVTTDNSHTAEYVRMFNKNCTVIPDCPQVEAFDREREHKNKKASDENITIGWVGSPSTSYNLFTAWEALERISERFPKVRLRLVGTGNSTLPPFEKVKWSALPFYSQAEMINEVFGMDIGLFPLQDTEACRVRGVLKASVYMSGGAIPVCSPVGQVPDFVVDGMDGFIARDTNEWVEKIESLITDASLRMRMAEQGLKKVRNELSVEKSFMLLNKVLRGETN
jgi:glycosyltransferase involved in cell wall biosynthesis